MTFYFNNCLVKYLHATFILFWVWKLLLCLHHYNSIFSDHSPLGDHSQVFLETWVSQGDLSLPGRPESPWETWVSLEDLSLPGRTGFPWETWVSPGDLGLPGRPGSPRETWVSQGDLGDSSSISKMAIFAIWETRETRETQYDGM